MSRPSSLKTFAIGLALAGLVCTTVHAQWSILAPGTTTATNIFVAVGDNGTVLRSEDALTWTLVTPFTTANLRSVVFGGRFVAVGDDGAIFTSTDGTAWESRNSNTTSDLAAIVREIAGYTAVGEAGAIVSTFQ